MQVSLKKNLKRFIHRPTAYLVLLLMISAMDACIRGKEQPSPSTASHSDTQQAALHQAALEGDYHALIFLLQEYPESIDTKNIKGETMLHIAAKKGDLSILQILLTAGAKLDMTDQFGQTPLHTAIKNEGIEAATALLQEGARCDIPDIKGNTPLHLAAKQGIPLIANELIHQTAELNQWINRQNKKGQTPLHIAAKKGNEELVKIILSKGAKLNLLDQHNQIPLHIALIHRQTEIAQVLLKHETKCNIPDQDDNIALHIAAEKGLKTIAVELLKNIIGRKIWINKQNKIGKTALHLAAQNGHLDIVQSLLSHEANTNTTDLLNHTPLYDAIQQHHFEIAHSLLQREDIQINEIDDQRNTLLHHAVQTGNLAIIYFLLDKKAPINAVNIQGDTPLHLAIIHDQPQIATLLLEHQADASLFNQKGQTPLHLAAIKGSKGLVKVLLDHGACVSKPDSYGRIPINLINTNDEENYIDITKLLLLAHRAYKIKNQVTTDSLPQQPIQKSLHTQTPANFSPQGEEADHEIIPVTATTTSIIRKNVSSQINKESISSQPREAMDYKIIPVTTTPAIYKNKPSQENNQVISIQQAFDNYSDDKEEHLPVNSEFIKPLQSHNKRKNYSSLPTTFRSKRSKRKEVLLPVVQTNLQSTLPSNSLTSEAIHTQAYRSEKNPSKQHKKQPSNRNASAHSRDLHLATKNNNINQVRELILNGFDVNTQDAKGYTALHIATIEGFSDIVKILLENGADISIKAQNQSTALHMVAYKYPNILSILLESTTTSAIINEPDATGRTPLHWAAKKGSLDAVLLLLQHHALLQQRDNYKKTPVDLAREYKHQTIVNLFVSIR